MKMLMITYPKAEEIRDVLKRVAEFYDMDEGTVTEAEILSDFLTKAMAPGGGPEVKKRSIQ